MMTEPRVETSHCQIDLFAKCVLIVIENLYRYCGKFGSTLKEFGEYFISVFNQLDAQNLFHNKFHFMPLHVSNTCAHHQEEQILCIKLVKY